MPTVLFTVKATITAEQEEAFNRWISTNVYEHYRDQDIEEMAFAIRKVAKAFSHRGGAEDAEKALQSAAQVGDHVR